MGPAWLSMGCCPNDPRVSERFTLHSSPRSRYLVPTFARIVFKTYVYTVVQRSQVNCHGWNYNGGAVGGIGPPNIVSNHVQFIWLNAAAFQIGSKCVCID